ncbi:MAG: DUF86 domain-containing protein, partial [Armatimonadota bacterium]|nr:DUF86 domain-containing protein [Armatimonadota bacterium]MDW8142224.1 DUF86 domain-containing protein [Armatimonadota bacterium]
GLPAEEDDIFEKLVRASVISDEMAKTLRRMKGFRNILVHEYGRLDDQIVFDIVVNRISDFEAFKREVLEALQKLYPQASGEYGRA